MRFSLHGVRIPHIDHTAHAPALRLPVPATVEIPMQMHIGAPAKICVKVGDEVRVGQIIGEPGGVVSSPVHASVSGTVKRLGEITASNGRRVQTVVIESDGLQTPFEGIAPPVLETTEDFLRAVRNSGIVGLGGAGFPTEIKLTLKDPSKLKAVIVNCAECEPLITSDSYTMLNRGDDIMAGAALIRRFIAPPRLIFAVERDRRACIAELKRQLFGEAGMELKLLKSLYPQGGEKVLIYNTLGAIVREGQLPIDVGAIVINVTTLSSIGAYARTGMPLTEKLLTVEGSAVREPKNVFAPIGMRLGEVFEAAGGFKTEAKKVLYGGPMMGVAVPDLDQPILKTTNAIIALNEKDATPPAMQACIKCGRCIAHCPLGLMPAEIETSFRLGRLDLLDEYKVNLCMECGCCSYGCPAHRPLVQTNKLAKIRLAAEKAAGKEGVK